MENSKEAKELLPIFNSLNLVKSVQDISFLEWFLLLFRPSIMASDYGDEGTYTVWTKELFGKHYIVKSKYSPQGER